MSSLILSLSGFNGTVANNQILDSFRSLKNKNEKDLIGQKPLRASQKWSRDDFLKGIAFVVVIRTHITHDEPKNRPSPAQTTYAACFSR